MQKRQQATFTTVHSEGTLFTGDVLQRIAKRDPKLNGMALEDYHLLKSDQFNEVITTAWEEALKAWSEYQRDCQAHPERHLALTREWVLKLLSPLNYGRVQKADAIQTPQRNYAVSHSWQHIPIHLVSHKGEREGENTLDKSVRSSADSRRGSPHSTVQELLNNVDGYLWGIVSNGKLLRMLRKSVSMTRQAYIEFDLEAMMQGEVYADFILFWLLCHQSRLEGEKSEDCWLEKWLRLSRDSGIRALDKLRDGVQNTIGALGTGFLRHPANRVLHEKLRAGELDTQDYYRQVLRLVYRFIIIFVAEDRQVLFHPQADTRAKARYNDYYSTARLRRLAEKRTGTQHSDLYQSLSLVMRLLGSEEGYLQLGLFALNGFLFADAAMPDLANCQLANQDLLEALRALALIRENNVQFPVDYEHLGSEELGSVYESLLELVPVITTGKDATVSEATFELQTVIGNERKTTGSYYTPTSLIDCLLDSALEPVLEEACRKANPEQAILDLKVCDPACGSGHFLVAAAYRIAKRLASFRSGDAEPSAELWRQALREVVGHCIYGVDINPMSVELCKFRLWMETIEPGKPLSFLDAHILEGNSLIGATPALLAQGIPDSAFEPIEGDDKKLCGYYKKQNKEQRAGQLSLLDPTGKPWERLGNLATSMMQMDEIRDDTVKNYHLKQEYYEQFVRSNDYLFGQLLADTWCAAFVWEKTDEFAYPITHEVFRKIERNPYDIESWMKKEIIRLRQQYKFFHWHLAFPGVFRVPTNSEEPDNKQAGWCGGFDVMVGNPPWNAIEADKNVLPEKRREIASFQGFISNSCLYKLTNKGRRNLYALFGEIVLNFVNYKGRIGVILPSGIVTDKPNEEICRYLVKNKLISELIDFENHGIFPVIHNQYRFCLLTVSLNGNITEPVYGFLLKNISDKYTPNKTWSITFEEIKQMSPTRFSIPCFNSSMDAELTKKIYKSGITLNELQKNFYDCISSYLILNYDNNSKKIKKEFSADIFEEDYKNHLASTWLTVYEGEYFYSFDHRYATYEGNSVRYTLSQEKNNPNWKNTTLFFVSTKDAMNRLEQIGYKNINWYLGLRRQSRISDEISSIAAILPRSIAEGSVSCFFGKKMDALLSALICANFNTYAFNYVVRIRQNGPNLSKSIYEQIPFSKIVEGKLSAPGSKLNLIQKEIISKVVELTYTSWDLQQFAQDCGYNSPPFIWDEERRFRLRCEIEATYFHLYGIERDDVDYIMETFPIVKRKDEKQHGEYRTKRVILEMYDEMKRAMETSEPYQTWLNPPPADPSVAHPPREEVQAT